MMPSLTLHVLTKKLDCSETLCQKFVLSKELGTRNLLQMERAFMRIDVRFSQSLAGGKIATILDNGSCFWLYTLHKAVCFHKIVSGHNSDPWPLFRSSDAQILLSIRNCHTNVTERRVNRVHFLLFTSENLLQHTMLDRNSTQPERIYNSHYGNGVPAMFTSQCCPAER